MCRLGMWRLALFAVLASAGALKADTLDTVRRGFAERVEAAAEIRVTFSEAVTYLEGTIAPFSIPGQDAPRAAFPPENVTQVSKWEVKIDGEKFAFKRTGPSFDHTLGQFVENIDEFTYDGHEARFCKHSVAAYQSDAKGNFAPSVSRPMGSIRKSADASHYYADYHLYPLSLNLRPFIEPFSPYTLDGWQTRIVGTDDTQGVLLSHDSSPSGDQFLVHSVEDCAFSRIDLFYDDGAPFIHTEIELQRKGDLLLPASWTTVCKLSDGRTSEICRATVESVEFGPSQRADFLAQFPVGARVRDALNPGLKEYKVKRSGEWREILPSEEIAPHQLLMETSTGEAVMEPRGFPFAWLLWAFPIVGIGCFLFLKLRRV